MHLVNSFVPRRVRSETALLSVAARKEPTDRNTCFTNKSSQESGEPEAFQVLEARGERAAAVEIAVVKLSRPPHSLGVGEPSPGLHESTATRSHLTKYRAYNLTIRQARCAQPACARTAKQRQRILNSMQREI